LCLEANTTLIWLKSRQTNCRRLGLRRFQEHVPRARIGICPSPSPSRHKVINMNICGIDIHKSFLQIAVIDSIGNIVYQERCRYSLIDIILLIAKLAKMRCMEVAMESTGAFWIPLYYEFAGRGFKTVLANPASTKSFGNKTDMLDAVRIARRHLAGALIKSHVPKNRVSITLRIISRLRINKIVKNFVDICISENVTEIVCGDLRGIRNKCRKGNGSKKKNKIINNFWSYHYIVERLKITAENYGKKLTLIDESNTSSYCPICGVGGRRMYRGLFYCKKCGKKMNADVVGALNIARKCGVKIPSNIKLHPKSIKIRETIILTRDNRMQTHPSNLHIG